MAVIVEKAEQYRTCNSCASKDNVVNISVRMRLPNNTTQGSQIAVCEECAKKLLDQLQERFR